METQANNFRIKILPKVKVCVEIPKLQNYLLGTPTSPHSDPKVLRQLKGNKFLGILFLLFQVQRATASEPQSWKTTGSFRDKKEVASSRKSRQSGKGTALLLTSEAFCANLWCEQHQQQNTVAISQTFKAEGFGQDV